MPRAAAAGRSHHNIKLPDWNAADALLVVRNRVEPSLLLPTVPAATAPAVWLVPASTEELCPVILPSPADHQYRPETTSSKVR